MYLATCLLLQENLIRNPYIGWASHRPSVNLIVHVHPSDACGIECSVRKQVENQVEAYTQHNTQPCLTESGPPIYQQLIQLQMPHASNLATPQWGSYVCRTHQVPVSVQVHVPAPDLTLLYIYIYNMHEPSQTETSLQTQY